MTTTWIVTVDGTATETFEDWEEVELYLIWLTGLSLPDTTMVTIEKVRRN